MAAEAPTGVGEKDVVMIGFWGRLVFVAIFLFMGGGAVFAASTPRNEVRPPYVLDSKELINCESMAPDDKDGTQWGGIITCLRAELSRQDGRLNVAYAEVRGEFKKKGDTYEKMLVSGQRSWVLYRDSWCKVQASSGEPPPPELLELACKVEMTVEQLGRVLDQKN